jgi:hypothetical protein
MVYGVSSIEVEILSAYRLGVELLPASRYGLRWLWAKDSFVLFFEPLAYSFHIAWVGLIGVGWVVGGVCLYAVFQY